MRARRRDLAAEVARLRADNARLENRVARLRTRLDGDPELSYLFVMTYGRSGSTLVSGLLNALPGYLIRGENEHALHHLFSYHRTLAGLKERWPSKVSRVATHPFFGIGDVPVKRSVGDVRRLALSTVLRPEDATRVVGFKEIRWYHQDMEEYVAWLREVFPGARFLVNTRNNDDVLSSGWWAKGDPDHNRAHLAETEERLLAVAADLGEAAYRVHYDDYVADPTTLRGLYDWLGEPWDEASVRATLAVRHSL
ncbi:sulfotransferase [Nocardioides sp.]|uniref:sulfotransferase n=1 Tax=Nocardioides sp. TaxID=35761 RepID=UPI002B273E0B|nr:sulfotransferase [Nocardioides sp.]